jgi:hypothetical protein
VLDPSIHFKISAPREQSYVVNVAGAVMIIMISM